MDFFNSIVDTFSQAGVFMGKDFLALLNITMIDLVLAGDNAIVVGMAASRVPQEMRARVIFWGMMGAVVLRILFALVTTHLLAIVGLTLAGGILLLWVCWKMYREITKSGHEAHDAENLSDATLATATADGTADGAATAAGAVATMSFGAAIMHIVVADISMSLDNVLAVAGAAKGASAENETMILVIGLGFAILLMAIAANYIAKLLTQYPWITWIGLLIILYVAIDMIWRGSQEVACQALDSFWCNHSLFDVMRAKIGI